MCKIMILFIILIAYELNQSHAHGSKNGALGVKFTSLLQSCIALVITCGTRLALLIVYHRYLQRSRFVGLQTPNNCANIAPLKLWLQDKRYPRQKSARNFVICSLSLMVPVVALHQKLRSCSRASTSSLLGVDFARIFCNKKCFKAFNTTFIAIAAMFQATEGRLDRMNVH